MKKSEKILIIGAKGQVGQELVEKLRDQHGHDQVVASDIRQDENDLSPFEILDVLNPGRLHEVVKKHGITEIYHLAALLSANAEKKPKTAWDVNMNSLFHVLELAKEGVIKKIFWPSSIAVFGPNTPKINAPQYTLMEPNTVYGISKFAGERWCEYYFRNYGVDVRSVRYPGLIGHKSQPGGGTTDYAVHIFHEAVNSGKYECFLAKDTKLPMMYMSDAIRATLKIMNAESNDIKIRSSYNITGLSFSPEELALEIKQHLPDFEILYCPDIRQKIATNWPQSVDSKQAMEDWGWTPKYHLKNIVADMLKNIKINCNIALKKN